MSQAVVLLAEDEPVVRQLVVFALQQENFIVLPTCDAAEALQMFHTHGNVDLLLTDVQLGAGMNGVDLAEHILKEDPETKVLLMSGFTDSEELAAGKNLPFLSKPFLPNTLVERLRAMLTAKIPAQSETGKTKLKKTTG